MSTRDTFVEMATRRLAGVDLSGIPGGGLPSFLDDAVAEHSRNKPQLVVVTIEGDGTDFYAVPDEWIDRFASLHPTRGVRRVPSQDYTRPAVYARDGEFTLQRDEDGDLALKLSWSPAAGDDVVLEFTAPHVVDDEGSTIEREHETALADLAASLVCEAKLLSLGDVSMEGVDADISLGDVGGRGNIFRDAAARLRKRYEVAVGISGESGASGAATNGETTLRVAHSRNDWRWGNRRPY